MEALKLNERTTTLVDVVQKTILEYIKKNHLSPGDKLLSEEALSKQLGVGRNVVREALSGMKSFGILESRKKRGIVLQELDVSKNLDKIFYPEMLSKDTIVDLLELRYTIETGIAHTLFSRIQDKDITDLERILKSEVVMEDGRIPIMMEQTFHTRIYQIIGNQVILNMQQTLFHTYRYMYDHFREFSKYNEYIIKNNLKTSHKDILEALKSGDEKRYSEAIRHHLYAYYLYVNDYRNNITK